MASKRKKRSNKGQDGPAHAKRNRGNRPLAAKSPRQAAKSKSARTPEQAPKDESSGKRLCVVMPALNEEPTVRDLIERIPRDIPGISDVIVILVDDGSIDRTPEVARRAGAIVITHPETRGVGLAFQAGVKKTLELGADFMVNMDADGQFNPEDIPKLVEPLLEGRAGFVTASRFIDKKLKPKMGFVKYLGNIGMSALVSILARSRFYDVSCGFRAYTRETLQQLNLFGHFTYTQETFLDLSFKGVTILEVPIRVLGKREHGESRVASNLFRYAFNTSKIVFRSFRDYRPMHVFGLVSGLMFLVATGLSVFLLQHWYRTGTPTPHKWAGFTAAALYGMGFLVFMTGLIGDMLARIRINQERILYLLRKRDIEE